MLPRSHRIDGATIRTTLPRAKPYRISWGTVRFYSTNKPARITIIVSKKVAKTSPDRHRIKRKIYHAVHESIHLFPSGNYFIFPDKLALTAPSRELAELARELATRMHPSRTL